MPKTSAFNPNWPLLRQYDADHLHRIALPLGGIGTGTVSLGGRGDLRDWEVMNRPGKGFLPCYTSYVMHIAPPVFALYAKVDGADAVSRALEGPLDLSEYEGPRGSPAGNHGLPHFRNATFGAAYPFGQLLLSDSSVPVDVRLEAFNPLIPGNAEDSGLPIVVLRYVLTNKTKKNVTASVCGSIPNFIGSDGSVTQRQWGDIEVPTGSKANRNTYRESGKIRGVFMESGGVDPKSERWGTLALSTTATSGISHRTSWAKLSWGDSILDFWDDFSSDGVLENRTQDPADETPTASLAVKVKLAPGQSKAITFHLTWHFPNRQTWFPVEPPKGPDGEYKVSKEDYNTIGNFYTTQFADAWDVVEQTSPRLGELESKTIGFVKAFCESDLPEVVKEAALFNVSTLRTQTCFRTPDGRFFVWEGSHDHSGSCHGSCTHVWNYEQATAFLFGSLARSMREIEFAQATNAVGLMSFRVNLPIQEAKAFGKAAADGQMGCIMKLYRDWQLSGDEEMLRHLWPGCKRSLEFCWIKGGWDADQDGVMEGCQHNTMDVEYFGPNGQMQSWYLGALRASEEMARHLGDDAFADQCRKLFEFGSQWMDKHLFNGQYYEQEIRPIPDRASIAEGLTIGMGSPNMEKPDLQLGAACLVDQLVGQYMAHICGLGYLLNEKNVKTTVKSIRKFNFKKPFHDHFNHLRSFVLGDEGALLMATYPLGRRPTRPFPYYNEVMTGFEYTAAAHMLYEGLEEIGLECISAIRERYDGKRRSPFNEAECGHHYGRAMASWAAVLALTGFRYSGVSGDIHFAKAAGKKPVTWFWSNGDAWGTLTQKTSGKKVDAVLHVIQGPLKLRAIHIDGVGSAAIAKDAKTIASGKSVSVSV